MVEKILFNLIAFSLFTNIFFLKLVKKNDTSYLTVIIAEAIGITINFISIIFNIWDGIFIRIIMYLLAIILPIVVIALEKIKHCNKKSISYPKQTFNPSIKNRPAQAARTNIVQCDE